MLVGSHRVLRPKPDMNSPGVSTPDVWDARGLGPRRLPKPIFPPISASGDFGAGAGYDHPLYDNPVFTQRNLGRIAEHVEFPDYTTVTCPECERLCREMVWLPQTHLLAEPEEMMDIVAAVRKVRENVAELQ